MQFFLILFVLLPVLLSSCHAKEGEGVSKKLVSYKEEGVTECNVNFKIGKPLKGCEGEACMCQIELTKSPRAKKSVDIFSRPSLDSKIVARLRKGDEVKKATPYMVLKNLGIVKLKNSNRHYFSNQYIGEGYYSYCNGKNLASSLDIEVIRESNNEKWLNIILRNGTPGWVKGHESFFFNEGC